MLYIGFRFWIQKGSANNNVGLHVCETNAYFFAQIKPKIYLFRNKRNNWLDRVLTVRFVISVVENPRDEKSTRNLRIDFLDTPLYKTRFFRITFYVHISQHITLFQSHFLSSSDFISSLYRHYLSFVC